MVDLLRRLRPAYVDARFVSALLTGVLLACWVLAWQWEEEAPPRTSAPPAQVDRAPVVRTSAPGLAPDSLPGPQPDLTPQEVVREQLKALRDNDAPSENAGIRTAFRFASPANKQATGPIDNFTRLLKSERYRPMVNHLAATFGEAEVRDGLARIPVRLTGPRGLRVTYLFQLTRHTTPTCTDCWMTDAVVVLDADTGGEKI